MLIATNSDAQTALLALANDITATETTQVPQIGTTSGIFGWLGITSPGSAGVQQAANDLLNDLATRVQNLYSSFDGSDTPLTAQQVAQMKLVQQQVIDERAEVQSIISDLDWTFGQFVSDTLTAAKNLSDQVVNKVATGLGLNWTVVKIGGGILAVILGYAAYRRVRG
jgi:hypothetical protein